METVVILEIVDAAKVVVIFTIALWFMKSIYSPNTQQIMAGLEALEAKIDELNAEVLNLQTTAAAEHAQVNAAVAELSAEIASLKDQLANGITPEAVQAAVDRLEATKQSLANAVTAVEDIYNDAPAEEPAPTEETPTEEAPEEGNV